MRILVVEDSERLRSSISKGLREAGFAVDAAEDGEVALQALARGPYDVVVLDLLLPRVDGRTVLARMRADGMRAHVLVLSALGDVHDRVDGLRLGADDYLAKPFAFEELLARIQALVRRRYDHKQGEITLGDLTIDTVGKIVSRGGREIVLQPRELALLEYLAYRRGKVCSRHELEQHLYGQKDIPFSNAVDSAVCSLRSKLGDGSIIRTRRGLGYVLETG